VQWNEFTITEAITGFLYQPQMMMSVEQSVECLAGETEVLRGNPDPGRYSGKLETNHLSYSTADIRPSFSTVKN
jgi:hypothetical protein